MALVNTEQKLYPNSYSFFYMCIVHSFFPWFFPLSGVAGVVLHFYLHLCPVHNVVLLCPPTCHIFITRVYVFSLPLHLFPGVGPSYHLFFLCSLHVLYSITFFLWDFIKYTILVLYYIYCQLVKTFIFLNFCEGSFINRLV